MTEEEAKTKWCPHVRYFVLDIEADQPCNRHGEREDKEAGYNPPYARCIASACMMWRTATKPVLYNPETKEVKPSVWGQSYDGSKFIVLDQSDPEQGYCGLAGKP